MPAFTAVTDIRAALPSVAAAVRERGAGPIRWRLDEVTLRRVSRVSVAGSPPHLEHLSTLTETATGSRLTDTVRWRPALPAARLVVGAALRRRAGWIRARAEYLQAAPVVVGAAVVRDGRVLAQQRARPAELAGRWELPGGRVEPGELAADALTRECEEELAVRVVAGARLGPDVPLPSGLVLRIHLARLADPAARPVAVEHAALRWVRPDELESLDWLDSDRAVLPDLRAALADPGAGVSDPTAGRGDRPVP